MSTEGQMFLHYVLQHLFFLFLAPLAFVATVGSVGIYKAGWTRKFIEPTLAIAMIANSALVTIVAIAYLFYPNYIDHVESTIASLGEIFRRGDQIYPPLSDYSMHGLLYGPGLSEIESLFLSLGLPVILASKLPGVLSMLTTLFLVVQLYKNNFARSYLILLFPYGLILFWNRSEPLFLLIVTLSLWLLVRSKSTAAAILIGCLAGIASCLKLHAMVYVFAAIWVAWQYDMFTLRRGVAIMLGMLTVVVLAFAPPQVSASSFLVYLALAGKHGISLNGLLKNVFYLFVIFAPVFYLAKRDSSATRKQIVLVALLFCIELFVAIIGSKPGAGPHHLLPFVPINAYLIQRMLSERPILDSSLIPFKIGLLAVSLGSLYLLIDMSEKMIIRDPIQRELNAELDGLTNRYQGIVLGASDDANYEYVFLRPLLESKGIGQIDYAAYMDLEFSGVSDDVISHALRACTIRYLALPNLGQPFTLTSSYTNQPLLSDKVRSTFEENFSLVTSTEHYHLYACQSRVSRQ